MKKFLLTLIFLLNSSIVMAVPVEPPVANSNIEKLFQLNSEDVEAAVSQALVEKGAGDMVSATVLGQDKSKPIFSYNKPISVELRGLEFDKSSNRWTANILALSEEEVVSALPIGGRFEEVIEVPVLKKQIRAGEIISEDDLEYRKFAVARTRAETVTDGTILIGQSPVRTISAGRPIRAHEVAGPTLIEKDSIVQISYEMPGIEITATGQAMESGSKGSLIEVKNLSSKKVIHAVVKSKNNVSIPTLRPQTTEANNSSGASYAAK